MSAKDDFLRGVYVGQTADPDSLYHELLGAASARPGMADLLGRAAYAVLKGAHQSSVRPRVAAELKRIVGHDVL